MKDKTQLPVLLKMLQEIQNGLPKEEQIVIGMLERDMKQGEFIMGNDILVIS